MQVLNFYFVIVVRRCKGKSGLRDSSVSVEPQAKPHVIDTTHAQDPLAGREKKMPPVADATDNFSEVVAHPCLSAQTSS